jgi:hypothetical protein
MYVDARPARPARPASTPRTSVGYVPADLATRGIVAATVLPKPSSSEPTHYARCGIVGCLKEHPMHYCETCHDWVDCPHECGRY